MMSGGEGEGEPQYPNPPLGQPEPTSRGGQKRPPLHDHHQKSVVWTDGMGSGQRPTGPRTSILARNPQMSVVWATGMSSGQ